MAALDGQIDCEALRKPGDADLSILQGLAVVYLCGGGHGQRQGLVVAGQNLQRAQILDENIVILICGAPINLIGVFALAGLRLAAGGVDFHRRRNLDRCKVRLLGTQRPAVVVGDLRIDRDADIRAVPHQPILINLVNLQTVLDNAGLFNLLQFLDPGGQRFRIPAGIETGLCHQFRVILIKAQNLLREILHGHVLNHELNALLVLLTVQNHPHPLAGVQNLLDRLARERIRCMHPGRAADSVHDLTAGRCGGRKRGIPPDRFTGDVAGNRLHLCLRAGQRLAVVDLFRASGPDSQRRRIHGQHAIDRRDVGKVGIDVIP